MTDKWQDKPDAPGRWWCKKNGQVSMHIIKCRNGNLFIVDRYNLIDVTEADGQWQKVKH
ncbi:MAG: hypothetical protein OEW37_05980 [Rhodospirillaceae bacterium]|nr:hypothetical protein [Rhodospirillaceae bacterium]